MLGSCWQNLTFYSSCGKLIQNFFKVSNKRRLHWGGGGRPGWLRESSLIFSIHLNPQTNFLKFLSNFKTQSLERRQKMANKKENYAPWRNPEYYFPCLGQNYFHRTHRRLLNSAYKLDTPSSMSKFPLAFSAMAGEWAGNGFRSSIFFFSSPYCGK